MNNSYFKILVDQLKLINLDLSLLIGKTLKLYYEEMLEKRKLNFKPIHIEFINRWIFNNTEINRDLIKCADRAKYLIFDKLKDRDDRNKNEVLSKSYIHIHPGRTVLYKGEKRVPGRSPYYEIDNILNNKLNIYLGGHKLLNIISFDSNYDTSYGLQIWKGVLAHNQNTIIYELLKEIGLTDKEKWNCSFGSNENKSKILKKIFNYLLSKDS